MPTTIRFIGGGEVAVNQQPTEVTQYIMSAQGQPVTLSHAQQMGVEVIVNPAAVAYWHGPPSRDVRFGGGGQQQMGSGYDTGQMGGGGYGGGGGQMGPGYG